MGITVRKRIKETPTNLVKKTEKENNNAWKLVIEMNSRPERNYTSPFINVEKSKSDKRTYPETRQLNKLQNSDQKKPKLHTEGTQTTGSGT